MDAKVAEFPNILKKDVIGKSVNNLDLIVVRITNFANTQYKPQFKWVGNMHGDETVGREMLIKLIDDLTSKYSAGDSVVKQVRGLSFLVCCVALCCVVLCCVVLCCVEFCVLFLTGPHAQLVDAVDISIMPTMNPDGFERRQRGNARNYDLNRNFPDQFGWTTGVCVLFLPFTFPSFGSLLCIVWEFSTCGLR